jgi:hypothetical protein
MNSLWCAENLMCVKASEDDAWKASKRVEQDIKKIVKKCC